MKEVWIVDDDEAVQFYCGLVFEGHKNKIESVCSFLDAKYAFTEFEKRINDGLRLPDVILLDINMPLVNGWQFLEQLESLNAEIDNIQIFMFTSSVSTIDIDKSKDFKLVNSIITKPLEPDSIELIIGS